MPKASPLPYHEARSSDHKRKVLDHLELHQSENQGHAVTHHYDGFEHNPEVHVFGAHEGHKLVAHLIKHANINAEIERALESEEEGEKPGLGDKVKAYRGQKQPQSRYS